MHPDIDRSATNALLGYKKRGDYEIALWDDGVVTKRMTNGKLLSWKPDGGAERFLKHNRGMRLNE